MRKFIFKIKLHLKGVIHSLLQLLALLTFGWFCNSVFEMVVLYFCFFWFRGKFEKQFHAKTAWGCTIISMIVYYIASMIIPNKNISLILVVMFTYFINKISFYVRDYLDIKMPRDKKRNTNRQRIIEILGVENLTEKRIERFCVAKAMPKFAETIYLFLNNTLEDTAEILGVDTSTITRRIKNFIELNERME